MNFFKFTEFFGFLLTLIPIGILSVGMCKAILWTGLFYFGIMLFCDLAKVVIDTYVYGVRKIRSINRQKK